MGDVLTVPDEDLLKIRNFGEKSLMELKDRLAGAWIPSKWQSGVTRLQYKRAGETWQTGINGTK